MSKSSGEFLTVSLLESKGYDPLVYRFFCLNSHYRKSLVFSYENLDNSAVAFNKIIAKIATFVKDDKGEIDKAKYDELYNSFKDALDNDLNTSLAITALYDVLKADANGKTKVALINEFDKVLSLDLVNKAEKLCENNEEDDIPADVMELVEKRKQARAEKNFALADSLRDEIAGMGYVIEETRQGTKIRKK